LEDYRDLLVFDRNSDLDSIFSFEIFGISLCFVCFVSYSFLVFLKVNSLEHYIITTTLYR